MSDKVAVVILGAGKGTRMKSRMPKVLHKIGTRSMIEEVISTAKELNPEKIVVVVGFGADQVRQVLPGDVVSVEQTSQLGTGHAMLTALPELEDFDGHIITLYGDVPLLSAGTIQELIKKHIKTEAAVTILTAILEDPTGYGRVIRNGDGTFFRIVEQKDASAAERRVKEINSGVYCFSSEVLKTYLPQLTPQNKQGEYYLTDVLGLASKDGLKVEMVVAKDPVEITGVNDRVSLAMLTKIKNQRKLNKLMLSGVTIVDPDNTYIDDSVEIAMDASVLPGTICIGECKIESGAVVGPYTTLVDCSVQDGAVVERSELKGVVVKSKAEIGPFVHVKPGMDLAALGLADKIKFKD